MSTVAGETQNYPAKAAHRDRVEMEAVIPIGAGGAVGTIAVSDDPGIGCTHGAAGVYNLTFPASADTGGFIDCVIKSAAGTVRGFWLTAFAPNSGTAQITIVNAAGAATDPANGDELRVQLVMNSRKDF